MRVIALSLGILGGVVGFVFALFPLMVGGVGNASGELSDNQLVVRVVSALVAAVCGVIWSVLAFTGKKPELMALLLIVTAVWYLVSVWYFGVAGFIIFALAALFVLLGRKASQGTIQVG